MSALEDAQLLPQCQVLGEEPSAGTKAAQDQTQPEAEHGPCSYQIGAWGRTDNLLISWTDRILANHSPRWRNGTRLKKARARRHPRSFWPSASAPMTKPRSAASCSKSACLIPRTCARTHPTTCSWMLPRAIAWMSRSWRKLWWPSSPRRRRRRRNRTLGTKRRPWPALDDCRRSAFSTPPFSALAPDATDWVYAKVRNTVPTFKSAQTQLLLILFCRAASPFAENVLSRPQQMRSPASFTIRAAIPSGTLALARMPAFGGLLVRPWF